MQIDGWGCLRSSEAQQVSDLPLCRQQQRTAAEGHSGRAWARAHRRRARLHLKAVGGGAALGQRHDAGRQQQQVEARVRLLELGGKGADGGEAGEVQLHH